MNNTTLFFNTLTVSAQLQCSPAHLQLIPISGYWYQTQSYIKTTQGGGWSGCRDMEYAPGSPDPWMWRLIKTQNNAQQFKIHDYYKRYDMFIRNFTILSVP